MSDREMLIEAMDLLRLHRQWSSLSKDKQSDVIARGWVLFDAYLPMKIGAEREATEA